MLKTMSSGFMASSFENSISSEKVHDVSFSKDVLNVGSKLFDMIVMQYLSS